jgi:hypothetical protein
MKLLLVSCAMALAALVVAEPVVSAVLDSAFVEITADDVDDADPNNDITITTAADRALVVISIIGNLSTPTIADDQDNVWETVITQDGSGHRLLMWVKCDTVAATYTITLDSAAQTFLVTYAAEYSGTDLTSCVQDSGGGESASQSSPIDGADVDPTTAALIVGAGVSTVDLNADTGTTTREEGASSTTINLNFADKRAATAGTFDLDWTFTGTNATLNIVAAIGEDGGAAPSFVPGIINNPVRGGGVRLRQIKTVRR